MIRSRAHGRIQLFYTSPAETSAPGWRNLSGIRGRLGPECADEFLDRQTGGVLEVPRDGGCGEHDDQAGSMASRSPWKITRAHRPDLTMRKVCSTC